MRDKGGEGRMRKVGHRVRKVVDYPICVSVFIPMLKGAEQSSRSGSFPSSFARNVPDSDLGRGIAHAEKRAALSSRYWVHSLALIGLILSCAVAQAGPISRPRVVVASEDVETLRQPSVRPGEQRSPGGHCQIKTEELSRGMMKLRVVRDGNTITDVTVANAAVAVTDSGHAVACHVRCPSCPVDGFSVYGPGGKMVTKRKCSIAVLVPSVSLDGSFAFLSEKGVDRYDIHGKRYWSRDRLGERRPFDGCGRTLRFAPDGKYIAHCSRVGGQGWLELLRAVDGKVVGRLEDRPYLEFVAFSCDGKVVAVLESDGGPPFLIRFYGIPDLHQVAECRSDLSPYMTRSVLGPAGAYLAFVAFKYTGNGFSGFFRILDTQTCQSIFARPLGPREEGVLATLDGWTVVYEERRRRVAVQLRREP